MGKKTISPPDVFHVPFPTHPFWGRKAHLPGAKLLRIVERKREKNANFFSPTELVLEDNSVWEVFFEYAEKPLQWPLDTPCVLVREGERHTFPSSSYTTYLEELNSGDMVAAKRLR